MTTPTTTIVHSTSSRTNLHPATTITTATRCRGAACALGGRQQLGPSGGAAGGAGRAPGRVGKAKTSAEEETAGPGGGAAGVGGGTGSGARACTRRAYGHDEQVSTKEGEAAWGSSGCSAE